MRLLQIHQQRAGAAYSQRDAAYAEAFQAPDAELLAQLLLRRLVHEGPLVKRGGVEVPEPLLDAFLIAVLDYEFLGVEAGQKSCSVVQAALGHLERSRGHVQEGYSALVALESEASQVVVLFLLKQAVVKGDSRGYDFCHSPFNQFLGLGRVFQLVADCSLVAGADQFGKVDVEGVVGESSHRGILLVTVAPLREDNAQDLAYCDGVVTVAFIKIPDSVQKYSVRILGLNAKVLLKKWSVLGSLSHITQI